MIIVNPEITKVAVIGAGAMGSGIALLFAESGIYVNLVDIEQSLLDSGIEKINKLLKRSVEKGKLTVEKVESITSHIIPMLDIKKAVEGVELVIEAIIENEKAKKLLFSKLDKICKEGVIFASNTSTISITGLASVTNRASKVIGMHFFNPPTVMKLIEIVKGKETSSTTVDTITKLCDKLGKISVLSNEAPGFIVNRVLWQFLNEAYSILDEGIAEKEHIDQAIKLGLNHPMGPFELSDYIGLDVVFYMGEYISSQLGEKYKTHPLLKKMVEEGKLGRKTGEGFYKY